MTQLFELYTGQPPFDVVMLSPDVLMRQMKELATDRVPERWIARSNRLKASLGEHDTRSEDPAEPVNDQALQQWLEEVYFDEEKTAELSREELQKVGDLMRQMLWLEPSRRATALSLLQDKWFG